MHSSFMVDSETFDDISYGCEGVGLVGEGVYWFWRVAEGLTSGTHDLNMDCATLVTASLVAAITFVRCTALTTVDVYYESHCPDSQWFITDQLAPIWHKIEPYVQIRFIPFGKARSTYEGFQCQHGSKECSANMVQSCVLNFLEPGRSQLEFVSCFMAKHNILGKHCIDASNIPMKNIDDCINSYHGQQLQLEAEAETKHQTPGPRFVPTVVINKVYKDSDQSFIETGNFEKLICQYEPATC